MTDVLGTDVVGFEVEAMDGRAGTVRAVTEDAPPCLIVKPYVALYGVAATIEWAKRHGYTQAQINDIRKRCAI